VGYVQVKGENIFSGYWQMPEKTRAEFTSDGFFRTGDLGKLSEDNYLSLVGRAKDLIISGGMNVYPFEVESYLNQISGICESAVIGIPDQDFGEAVTAVIVVDDNFNLNQQQIKEILKPKLVNYKIPKKLFLINKLPRNTMGKVQKNKLREQFG
ncbi:MAG: AMP-binding enzyme, partial [Waterburya sp.]